MTRYLAADLDIAARTVWAEARGEGHVGMKAVVHVLLNRVRSAAGQFARDDTLATACLRHLQFSCWNKGDPNFDKMFDIGPDHGTYRAAYRAVLEAIDEADFTGGALHYYATTMPQPPSWSAGRKPCFLAGKHVFFNDVP